MLALPLPACVRVCAVAPALRCDTVDSDSSRAVVHETFSVAPHGFVPHCRTPCARTVLCCMPPSLTPWRTQTVIVGGQRDIIHVDYFSPLRFLLSFVAHVVLLPVHKGVALCFAAV